MNRIRSRSSRIRVAEGILGFRDGSASCSGNGGGSGIDSSGG